MIDAEVVLEDQIEDQEVDEPDSSEEQSLAEELQDVRKVETIECATRKEQLQGMLQEPTLLDPDQKKQLYDFLATHHEVFSLDEYDRGACLSSTLIQVMQALGESQSGECPLLSGRKWHAN